CAYRPDAFVPVFPRLLGHSRRPDECAPGSGARSNSERPAPGLSRARALRPLFSPAREAVPLVNIAPAKKAAPIRSAFALHAARLRCQESVPESEARLRRPYHQVPSERTGRFPHPPDRSGREKNEPRLAWRAPSRIADPLPGRDATLPRP